MTIFAANAVADSVVGYVQVDKIMQLSPRTVAIGRKLQKEFSARNAVLDRMEKQIKDQQDALEKSAASMSDNDRLLAYRNLSNQKLDLDRKRREQHEDFILRKNEELSNLQDLINKAVISVAETEGYDLVLYDIGVYVGKKVDITDKVVKQLGN
ncbi:MAG TPA: OmpH family outer membrane protein [Methylophilaceae bacterium]